MTTTEEKNNIDINAWRNGYKWTINECLRLEREHDLLKLSVPEMAILHKRTINAIMCKLQDEGYDTFNNLYIKTFGQEGGQEGTIFGQEGTSFGQEGTQQEGTQQETLEDHLDELVNKLNNLSCSVESEDEEDEEDDDDEDYEDESEDDDDDDESEEDDEEGEYKVAHNIAYDDGSNKAYIFDQVKQIHKHITNLLGYFTKTTSSKEMLSK